MVEPWNGESEKICNHLKKLARRSNKYPKDYERFNSMMILSLSSVTYWDLEKNSYTASYYSMGVAFGFIMFFYCVSLQCAKSTFFRKIATIALSQIQDSAQYYDTAITIVVGRRYYKRQYTKSIGTNYQALILK